MTFLSTAPIPAEPIVPLSETLPDVDPAIQTSSSNPNIAKRLDMPQIGEFKRELLTWRTPQLGYVQMYLNPQQIKIEDEKQITSQRTKGGFVVQYAGEELTKIALSGTTGSSGVEGINILRSIYRAEQESFEGISTAIEEALNQTQINTLGANALDLSPLSELNVFEFANDVFRNFARPQPTLASLATSLELFFQGWLYRGYFKSFTVTEKAEHQGWFDYSMMFVAYARQGVRRNFMPWHRQPVNPAGSGSNPLSFSAAKDILNTLQTPPPLATDTQDGPNSEPPIFNTTKRFSGSRTVSTAIDASSGINSQNGNLNIQIL